MKEAIRNLGRIVPLLVLLSAFNCFAQFTSGVQGTVLDPKGSAVPDVKVELTNVDTGVKQIAVSNQSGVYRFTSLAPGNYTVTGTVQGFAPANVSFNLATAQVRDVSLAMEVEHVQSTVTVSEQAPLLDTSDSRFEQTLDTTALQTLPLAGRNPT